MEKIDLNTLVYSKIKDKLTFTVEDTIKYYKMSRYFDDTDEINAKDVRPVRRGTVKWRGDVYTVNEFGSVKDETGSLVPIYTQKISGVKFDVVRKYYNGKPTFERVAVLMLIALKGAKNPRAIKFINYMPEMPTILSNLTYKETKEKEPTITKSMTKFIFDSQEELDGLLWTFDLSTPSDLAQHLDLELNEVNIDGFKVRRVEIAPDIAEYSLPVEIDGVLFRFNRFGGVMTLRNNVWGRHHQPFLEHGKIRMCFTTSEGKPRIMNVANKMILIFEGIERNIRVAHIDSNPRNLIYRNLWWKNCGHRRYFR